MRYNRRLTGLEKRLSNHQAPSDGENRTLFRGAAFVVVAVAFTLFGLILATNFDLTTRSVAQVPTNIGETGAYPIVDRSGQGDEAGGSAPGPGARVPGAAGSGL